METKNLLKDWPKFMSYLDEQGYSFFCGPSNNSSSIVGNNYPTLLLDYCRMQLPYAHEHFNGPDSRIVKK